MDHQPHITDYTILSDTEHHLLEQKVIKAVHSGWQPFGQLAVSTVIDPVGIPLSTYTQAMVKQAEWFR